MQHRFTKTKAASKTSLMDICDGSIYQEHLHNGFLSNPLNISFTLNTDGISVFKSSNSGLWPIFLQINELPIKQRKLKENTVLAGLWFGDEKPDMLNFLKPLSSSLKILYEEGVEIASPDLEHASICKAIVLSSAFDLPAKACALNMVQFNGNYSCAHCLQKGKQITTSGGGSVHIFPYQYDNLSGPVRTHSDTIVNAKKAFITQKPEFGIKGPTYLSSIPKYDLIRGTTIDYMHCVLLGVTRLLLGLWFSTEHHNDLWYCGKKVTICDEKLAQIKPPNYITRTPRSISKHRKYWKASEYRNWLLFYSIPVMTNILPPVYLSHHILLVYCMSVLLSSSITQREIYHAEKVLQHYVYKFEHYYDERYMTLNVHNLLHLPSVVSNLGPLYTTSCFSFESLNGQVLRLAKGTQGINVQIVHALHIIQQLPSLVNKHLIPDTQPHIFYQQLGRKIPLANEVCVNEKQSIFTVGSPQTFQPDKTHLLAIHQKIKCLSSFCSSAYQITRSTVTIACYSKEEK